MTQNNMQLPNMNIISTVKIRGSIDGFILTVEDSLGYKDDTALTLNELHQLYQLLKKRFDQKKTNETKRVQAKDAWSFLAQQKVEKEIKEEIKTSKKKNNKSVKKRTR